MSREQDGKDLLLPVEVRKVQMVGYSTLSVSLPKDWVKETGLKPGDLVSITRLEDGSLKVEPGITKREEKQVKKVIYADMCGEPGLLSRAIVALYLIGADNIVIIGSNLNTRQLDEIKKAISRLNGFGIVEQTSEKIMIQSFIDPTKFPVNGLLKRLHTITKYMIETSYKALKSKNSEHVKEVVMAEEEADKIYWLIVRQLLLASRGPAIARRIGVENPMNIVGNRLIAKVLEKIGDHAEGIALEVDRLLREGYYPEEDDIDLLGKYTDEVIGVYSESFNSLSLKDPIKANVMIETSNILEEELKRTALNTTMRYVDKTPNKRRLVTMFALKTYVDSLAQIVNLSGTIAEVAFNRSMEFPQQICKTEEA